MFAKIKNWNVNFFTAEVPRPEHNGEKSQTISAMAAIVLTQTKMH